MWSDPGPYPAAQLVHHLVEGEAGIRSGALQRDLSLLVAADGLLQFPIPDSLDQVLTRHVGFAQRFLIGDPFQMVGQFSVNAEVAEDVPVQGPDADAHV